MKENFNQFEYVRTERPEHNSFDMSFDNKFTHQIGPVTPAMCKEMLPGDHWTITPEMLTRLAPMTFPIMHRLDSYLHFFYVPNRILNKTWKKFITGEKYLDAPYTPLYMEATPDVDQFKVENGSLLDYMGLPTVNTMAQQKILAYPFLAYYKIMYEYFMDQNNDSRYKGLGDALETIYEKIGGKITAEDFGFMDNSVDPPVPITTYEDLPIINRGWQKDYFTSCLPFAQKGDAVNIPLSLATLEGEVNVITSKQLLGNDPVTGSPIYADTGGQLAIGANAIRLEGLATIDGAGAELAGTIRDLRYAVRLQEFLEVNARAGTRYNEFISNHFGVHTGDDRVQRPEYLGCIKNNVMISEVLQTSQTSDDAALGSYAGYGNAVVRGNTINVYAPEHGFLIAVASVKPRTAYFQGINKQFQRLEQLDYYFKQFAHVGEQAVKNKELYFDVGGTENEATFGYQQRYAEYKTAMSEVHGEFRDTLLDWHLAFKFDNPPVLSEEFVYVDPEQQHRIFAVTDPEVHKLITHIYFDIKANRPIPFYTDPSF